MTRVFLALFFTVFSSIAALAETRIVHSPGDGFLNLRTGPGSAYNIVRRMGHGSAVDILETKGGWSLVHHRASGDKGWAYRKYLVNKAQSPGMRRVHSPGDGFLNMRSGPGSDFAVLQRMYHGDRVKILERKGNWVRVRHGSGAKGWAYAKYLR